MRFLAGDTKFAIISNNCWGAHVYQKLRIPFASPFIGLFILPNDYIDLCENFFELIGGDLAFIRSSGSPAVNAWRDAAKLTYPIGLLGGRIEINFQHYASDEEAAAKWRRRCARITSSPERLFFKFDDRDGATIEHFRRFAALPNRHRVCFTAKPYAGLETVVVPSAEGEGCVVDGLTLSQMSGNYFNCLRWISTRPAGLPLPSII